MDLQDAIRALKDRPSMERELQDLREKCAKREWIKCSERLPEGGRGAEFLTWDGKYKCMGVHQRGYEDWLDVDGQRDPTITHWMPLPEPPTETKEGVE